MPVSALNALPRAVEQLMHPGLIKKDEGKSDIENGRYVTLLISLLIGVYVFRWSRELYGEKAGLFSLFLWAFCPNCLAHAALVTTDSYSALLLLAVMYYLWRHLTTRRLRDFWIFCVLTGIAQLVKQSLFHLYVLIPVLLLIQWTATRDLSLDMKSILKKGVLFLLINCVVINAGFYFQGFGTRLEDYHFMSGLFKTVQSSLSFFPSLRIPLPSSFLEGLDEAKYFEQLGGGFAEGTFGNVTILGHSSHGGSFWYYYFVTVFFKTPVAILCIMAWSGLLLVRRSSFRFFASRELFLLIPVLYFFILLDFFYKSQTNIRHIIFIYPLLYIFCGILFQYSFQRIGKGVLLFLSVAYLASVFIYFGNYIPYTNELIPDKKMAYRVVGAANLEFGQGAYFLDDFLRSHPGVTLADTFPRPGRQVIGVNEYMDVWNVHRYDWLKPFTPVDQVAGNYLIFDITADQIK